MDTNTTPKYTDEQVGEITKLGNLWVSPDGKLQRVYFNDCEARMLRAFNLKIEYYNSGNVCGATENGQKLSNADGRRWLASQPSKLWFDINACGFKFQGGERETAIGIIRTIKQDARIAVPQEA